MLRSAATAAALPPESRRRVVEFFRSRQTPGGGFVGRREAPRADDSPAARDSAAPSDAADLYYTVFGLEGLMALGAPPDAHTLRGYLDTFGFGEGLDFVHLCCLARCHADLRELTTGPDDVRATPDGARATLKQRRLLLGGASAEHPQAAESARLEGATKEFVEDKELRRKLLGRLAEFRSADGGFASTSGEAAGTAYACFLALAAWQDLDADLADAAGLACCLAGLRADDGGFANAPHLATGTTPATAAAAIVLGQLHRPVDPGVGKWLLARLTPEGGFAAGPAAPLADLLSTATALHALAAMNVPLDPLRERCLDFLDALWSPRGAFRAHLAGGQFDCEYAYYALLAMGHLTHENAQ